MASLSPLPSLALLMSFTILKLIDTFYYFYWVSCMSVLSACIPMYYLLKWCPWWPKEGIRVLGASATDGYELPCGSWESTPDLLEEQSTPDLLEERSLLSTVQS